MSDFDNTNRGSIWPNKKKESDKHPDFTGEVNVEGREFWVSAWKKKPGAKEGSPSLTFAVKMKEPKKGQKPQKQQEPDFVDSEDIPF